MKFGTHELPVLEDNDPNCADEAATAPLLAGIGQENQVAMRACPHDVRQCLHDGQSGPHRAVEALLRLLRCGAEMINRPEQRATRDCRDTELSSAVRSPALG